MSATRRFANALAASAADQARTRQLVALQLASPHRAPAGLAIERQHNTDALPLFEASAQAVLL